MTIKINSLPDYEYLHECFDYDPKMGLFKWKDRPLHHFSCLKGRNIFLSRNYPKKVGRLHPDGYLDVFLKGENIKLHRIAWKLMTGEDPIELIDHINGIKTDNTWTNLRAATVLENNRNTKVRKDSGTGYKNIYLIEEKYRVMVNTDKVRQKHIGYYSTLEEAIISRDAALLLYHGEFANNRH